MIDYWEQRFVKGGAIWGDHPSDSVEIAHRCFQSNDVDRLLVPGSGYGRNAGYFLERGYAVTGVEISPTAIAQGRERYPDLEVVQGSVLEVAFTDPFDAIYCFNVLHLFRADDRQRFIETYRDFLRSGGLAFFVVFSDQEPSFGKGPQVEPYTFETKPGRPVHYFTEVDLRAHFAGFDVLEMGVVEDAEDHGPGPHVHILRYICASWLG